MNFGPLEIGVILLIVLVVFGPKRLPQLGRGLGSGMREFKDAVTGKTKDDEAAEITPPAPTAHAPTAQPVQQPAETQPAEASQPPAGDRT